MIDSVQARVIRLDQEVLNLINCFNSEKEVIEVEFDDVRRDCEIFAQQVETNRILDTQLLEQNDQQIQTLDFILKEARMGINAIQDQLQQIIAGATEEFGNLKSRIEQCENEQIQMKVKQASLTLTYQVMQKRMTDLEAFVKNDVPNFEDLQITTGRVNEIADQTTGLTEAVAGAKVSITTPE
jgi:transcription initiation factor TFIID subunit TAF12